IWLVSGTIGGDRKDKTGPDALQKAFAARGIHAAQMTATSEFPDHPRALSAVSMVVLSGKFDLTSQQSAALCHWVRNGGSVVVVAGTRIEELESSPISDWVLDGRSVTASSLSDLSGLEAFARSSFRIPIVARIRGSLIGIKDGIDLVTGIEGPLLTRSAYGFGRITILGVDLDRPPLSRWRALDSFVAAIADLPAADISQESKDQRISHTGITELATQFQIGMETVPQVGERSTLTVLAMVLAFLLVIGPLDYLLVHRLLKKPGLTWLTFPAIVVAAGLLASSAAGGANGHEIRSKICELIDLDNVTGFTRQTVWSTAYSPEHRRYGVKIKHDRAVLRGAEPRAAKGSKLAAKDAPNSTTAANGTGWLSWVAAPESNFGGLYRASGLNLGGSSYRYSEGLSGFENLPIAAASDRIFASTATWTESTDLFDSALKQAGTGHLSRESKFTHHLPAAIDDWLLVYGNRVYFHDYRGGDLLGSSAIEPGVVWSATGATTGGRELRSFLTGSTFQRTGRKRLHGSKGDEEFEFSQVDWNRRETDLQVILRMITFFEIAGGQEYTRLSNHALSGLELSSILPLDRAVLIGRLNLTGAAVELDGQPLKADQQESFVRVVLTVDDAPIERSLPKFDNN
ncbi:MAG: hypothetical protein O3B86_15195, partial [Planctomycetota bacterium]|nr:hypothetical protein [Planctomycetota bacterium]